MDARARYDSIAEFYDETVRDDFSDPGTSALLQLPPALGSARVLDVACGQGRVSRELARRGANVVGIDISEELLVIARNAEAELPLGITYLRGDVAQPDVLPGDDKGFDGVVCNFGLSDIDDLDGALTTVERVLRQGGWFVFSILSPSFPGWDEDAPSSWSPESGYYREGWWLATNSGFRGRVGANHRMLSTYLNALVRHRLCLEQAVEPDPGEAWAARAPGRAAVPVYFVARCRKGVSQTPA
jgi:ubiquinone/menaquinone biosynthesis C-methylase UbiE